jgi:hypothetical protein
MLYGVCCWNSVVPLAKTRYTYFLMSLARKLHSILVLMLWLTHQMNLPITQRNTCGNAETRKRTGQHEPRHSSGGRWKIICWNSLRSSEMLRQICGGWSGSGEGSFPGFFPFPLLLFIPPLLHTGLSQRFEVCNPLEQAVYKSAVSPQGKEVCFVISKKCVISRTSYV